MNATTTKTQSLSRRPLLPALLALSVAAVAWPASSWAAGSKRTERPVPRQVAMSASTAAPASLHSLVSQQAEEQAYEVVRDHVSSLERCYKNMPAGGAKLELSFTIGKAGRATNIRVESRDLKGTAIPACVSAAVAQWPFPASVGARVSFPLLFVHE
jgi:hypothetical protein